jgi:hypothetical protein
MLQRQASKGVGDKKNSSPLPDEVRFATFALPGGGVALLPGLYTTPSNAWRVGCGDGKTGYTPSGEVQGAWGRELGRQ